MSDDHGQTHQQGWEHNELVTFRLNKLDNDIESLWARFEAMAKEHGELRTSQRIAEIKASGWAAIVAAATVIVAMFFKGMFK